MSIRSIRRAIDKRTKPERDRLAIIERQKASRALREAELDRTISARKPGSFVKKRARRSPGFSMLSVALVAAAISGGSQLSRPTK